MSPISIKIKKKNILLFCSRDDREKNKNNVHGKENYCDVITAYDDSLMLNNKVNSEREGSFTDGMFAELTKTNHPRKIYVAASQCLF